jgi:hypothetical protein
MVLHSRQVGLSLRLTYAGTCKVFKVAIYISSTFSFAPPHIDDVYIKILSGGASLMLLDTKAHFADDELY